MEGAAHLLVLESCQPIFSSTGSSAGEHVRSKHTWRLPAGSGERSVSGLRRAALPRRLQRLLPRSRPLHPHNSWCDALTGMCSRLPPGSCTGQPPSIPSSVAGRSCSAFRCFSNLASEYMISTLPARAPFVLIPTCRWHWVIPLPRLSRVPVPDVACRRQNHCHPGTVLLCHWGWKLESDVFWALASWVLRQCCQRGPGATLKGRRKGKALPT